MALLSDVIQRGTRGAQPAATSVAVGVLYGVTDEGDIIERSDGSAWQSYSPSGTIVEAITLTLDGAGVALTTGIKTDVRVPYGGTITRNSLLADQSGSIVIDIWKDTYANFPPTVADTITASAKPTLSAATKSEDTTLTGWTTTITAGDVLRFNVDSAATITRVVLTLYVTRA